MAGRNWESPASLTMLVLRLTLALAGWHAVEHTYILWRYLQTGIPGLPGLLGEDAAEESAGEVERGGG